MTQAGPSDAAAVARLLDDFNTEFGDPSPGPAVLAERLGRLLAGDQVVALLAGRPPVGTALVTLRPNVWFPGPVALLDELYVVPGRRSQGIGSALLAAVERLVAHRGGELVEINVDGDDVDARRFYERHGYRCGSSGRSDPELYYAKELAPADPES